MTDSIQSLPAESLPDTTFEKPQPKPYQQIQVQGKKSLQCLAPGCEKIFKYKSDMERHVLTHTKEKPIACPYPDCNKGFKRPEALRYHVDTMHINHQIFACPLPDCGHQTHKKEFFDRHMGKHSILRFCAENSPNDGRIYVPWRKVLAWEKRYWIKYKTSSEQQKKNSPPVLTESSLENLKNDWDILACLEHEDSGLSEKFFEQLQSLKNKDRDPTDPLLFDDSAGSISISGVRDLLVSICEQMTQESEKEKQFELPREKAATQEKPCVCPFPLCNQSFRRPDDLKNHVETTHLIYKCPLKDCGWQTHKKELLDFYHLGKHEYIRKCAENSPNDGNIHLPWKKVVDWEKRYWAKCKADFAEGKKNNQDMLSDNGLGDLKSDWDILSCLEEEDGKSTLSEKFFEQIESWKKKDLLIFSRDSSDTLSLRSFQDNGPCLITGARDLLRIICRQMTQENTVRRVQEKPSDLSNEKNE